MIYTTNLKRKSDLSIRDPLSTLDKLNSNKNFPMKYFFYFCSRALQIIMLRVWLTCIVILLVHHVHMTQAFVDYWDDEFDDDKNCAREEEMKELQRETEGARCAIAARSGIL